MAGSPKDQSTLITVATMSADFREARQGLIQEAMAEVATKLAQRERALEEAVMQALATHSVTEVARALTPPGKTPNRNKVYDIRNKYKDRDVRVKSEYPFEWVPREVQTVHGTVTKYDVHGVLDEFGPLDVTGAYTWTYYPDTDTLEPELDGTQEPYPTNKYYTRALEMWLMLNPYPGV